MGEFIDQKEERRLCADSFVYFCEEYLKVQNPKVDELVPFHLYNYQKRFIEEVQENRFVIGKKFRQGGFTTLMVAYYLWRAMFQPDEQNMILSKTDRESMWLSDIAKRFIRLLPEWLQPKLDKETCHEFRFSDTWSRLRFLTPAACCGMKIDNLYMDEVAFWPDAEKHWKAMFPTIAMGGNCVIMSTPNGIQNNWFYDTYLLAQTKNNDFHLYECEFEEHPEYRNIEWQKEMHKNLGDKGFLQEVRAMFLPPNYEPSEMKWPEEVELEVSEKDPIFFVSTKEEECDFMIEHQDDWDCEKDYDTQFSTDVPLKSKESMFDCRDSWDKDFEGPEVIQWATYSREAIHAMFEDAHKDLPEEVEHPSFDRTGFPVTLEEHVDFWKSVAELQPDWEEVAKSYEDRWKKKQEEEAELERKLNEHIQSMQYDTLAMAGIIDSSEAKELTKEDPPVMVCGRLDILQRLVDEGCFPETMKLDFGEEYLSVNKVPTKITTQSVKWAYMGLAALKSHDEAVKEVSELLKEKLKNLF